MNIKAEIATFGQGSHNCMMLIVEVKFMFSKKATKIDQIFTVNLTLCSKHQIGSEDFVNSNGLLKRY